MKKNCLDLLEKEKIVKNAYKNCFYLIKIKNLNLRFCLKFKLWNEPCPKKCGYFKTEFQAKIIEIDFNKVDIECNHCTRDPQKSKNSSIFFCLLTNSSNPFCYSCPFSSYDKI